MEKDTVLMELASRKNPIIVHMKKLGSDRDFRRESSEFVCDGIKMLREAVSCGMEITCVLAEKDADFDLDGMPVCRVPRDIIEYVSPLKNPQNVFFSCKMRKNTDKAPDGRLVILENIQDPGNVGTVIRSANAFNIDGVILTGSCADLYNPKTVRATMGAIFRQNVTETDLNGVAEIKKRGIKLYGAALGDGSRDIRGVELNGCAFVIGNEGSGLSREMLDLCDDRVIIPMNPQCESLNAAIAASVIMWEMSRNG